MFYLAALFSLNEPSAGETVTLPKKWITEVGNAEEPGPAHTRLLIRIDEAAQKMKTVQGFGYKAAPQ